ncbi:MAG: TetR/AcrR family transcriptional regulator [Proteobacteria bacterium]|nr:TetR/AcrR family transcriptional regulator [Pseudomonadota bacterium]
MPKISAASAARRRDHILEAARQCFAASGIHVSVDEICAKAGISKGAFYVYFSSKDAAIEAIVEDHKRVIATFAELQSAEALVEKLIAHTTARSPESARLELETWTHGMQTPSLRALLQDNVDSLRQVLTKVVTSLSFSAPGRESCSPAVVGEILTIFSLGLIASGTLGAQRGPRSPETALKALVKALVTETRQSDRSPRPRAASRS